MIDTPHRISLRNIELATRVIDPVFLRSPAFGCEPLSQAMAYVCRARGWPLVVYAAATANPMKIDRMRAMRACCAGAI